MSVDRDLPRLHVVTDDDVLARDDFVRRASTVVEEGRGRLALHVRGPHTSTRAVYELVEALVPVARAHDALLVVNDRLDVALSLAGVGVHLAGRSLPVAVARKVLGSGGVVGASTHDVAGATEARDGGADFVFVGHVNQTASHPGRAGLGVEGLQAVTGSLGDFPVVAIGGVTPSDVTAMLGAGAWGVASLRGVWAASDPVSAVRNYISDLHDGAATPRGRSRRGGR